MIGVVVTYFSTIDSDISTIRSQLGFDLAKSSMEAQLEFQTFASSCQQSNIDAQISWWITSCIQWKPGFVPNFPVSSGLRMPTCWNRLFSSIHESFDCTHVLQSTSAQAILKWKRPGKKMTYWKHRFGVASMLLKSWTVSSCSFVKRSPWTSRTCSDMSTSFSGSKLLSYGSPIPPWCRRDSSTLTFPSGVDSLMFIDQQGICMVWWSGIWFMEVGCARCCDRKLKCSPHWTRMSWICQA